MTAENQDSPGTDDDSRDDTSSSTAYAPPAIEKSEEASEGWDANGSPVPPGS